MTKRTMVKEILRNYDIETRGSEERKVNNIICDYLRKLTNSNKLNIVLDGVYLKPDDIKGNEFEIIFDDDLFYTDSEHIYKRCIDYINGQCKVIQNRRIKGMVTTARMNIAYYRAESVANNLLSDVCIVIASVFNGLVVKNPTISPMVVCLTIATLLTFSFHFMACTNAIENLIINFTTVLASINMHKTMTQKSHRITVNHSCDRHNRRMGLSRRIAFVLFGIQTIVTIVSLFIK